MSTSDFKNLRVWQQSMDLTTEIYQMLGKLPREEKYALADQIRRCSVSIPSNIAEGQARDSKKEFSHFLSISRGSLAELETQLLLCVRLGYLAENALTDMFERIKTIDKMIVSLMKTLNQ